MELLDKLLPVAGVIIGGILGFLANYFIGKSMFKKEIEQQKELHFRGLFEIYSSSINGAFFLINKLTDILLDLHQVKLTRKLENELESKVDQLLSDFDTHIINIDQVLVKYDFTAKMKLEDVLLKWREQIDELGNYIDAIEDKGKKIPIGDVEFETINGYETYFSDVLTIVQGRMREFYSERFLPNK